MTDEQILKALEEAVEQKKAICSIYDSALILTRESAEGIIEAYKSQKAEIERLKIENIELVKQIVFEPEEINFTINKAKSEAIKEFAERLKELPSVTNCEYEWLHLDIDNLVKEMEGETK